MKDRPLEQFQILMLIYTRLYKEFTGQDYDDVPRDWREAKEFMKWKDWNSETAEHKLREHLPQYLSDPFWKEQNFPAFGLFTQWNKFKAHSVRYKKPEIPRQQEPIQAPADPEIVKRLVSEFHVGLNINPNEKYRCIKCGQIHSPNFLCGEDS